MGFAIGLDREIKLAEKMNKSKLYPYIDRTNQARVNGVQVYTRGARAVAKTVCQTGIESTGVAVACGNERFEKMWQTNASGKLAP